MSVIFTATPNRKGELIFHNKEDLFKYCCVNVEKEQTVTIEATAKLTPKMRLYAYYHKVVLRNHAVKAFRNAGYEGEDEVSVSYRLEAMFAKIYLKKPDGTFDVGVENKRNMTKDRLLVFVCDVIHFLETELNEQVADSQEYLEWRRTGKMMKKIK